MDTPQECDVQDGKLRVGGIDVGFINSSRILTDLRIVCSQTETRFADAISGVFQIMGTERPERIQEFAAWTYEMLRERTSVSPQEFEMFQGVLEALGRTEEALMEAGIEPDVIFENVVAPRRALVEWWLGGRNTDYSVELQRYLTGDSAFWGEDISGVKAMEVTTRHMIADRFGTVDLARSFGPYIYLTTPDGVERYYIDFVAGFASMPFGWGTWQMENDLEYQRLLRHAAALKPATADYYHAVQAFSVRELESIVPAEYGYWFAIEGGSAVNDMAIKAAADWKMRMLLLQRYTATQKELSDFGKFRELVIKHGLENVGQKVMGIERAFHGRTAASLSATDSPDARKGFGLPKIGFFLAPHPDKEGIGVKGTLEAIEDELKEHGDEYCAIIVEPWQGEGGYNPMSPKLLRGLRQLADKYDVILIHDNIQVGMGRTGQWWPHEVSGVPAERLLGYKGDYEGTGPDIMTTGKIAQVGWMFALSKRFRQTPGNVFILESRINSTFAGNLPDYLRAGKYIQLIVEGHFLERIKLLEEKAFTSLTAIAEKSTILTKPRALGTLIAFDVPKPLRSEVQNRLAQKGLHLLTCGTQSFRLPMPYNTPFVVLDAAMRIIEETVAEFEKE